MRRIARLAVRDSLGCNRAARKAPGRGSRLPRMALRGRVARGSGRWVLCLSWSRCWTWFTSVLTLPQASARQGLLSIWWFAFGDEMPRQSDLPIGGVLTGALSTWRAQIIIFGA